MPLHKSFAPMAAVLALSLHAASVRGQPPCCQESGRAHTAQAPAAKPVAAPARAAVVPTPTQPDAPRPVGAQRQPPRPGPPPAARGKPVAPGTEVPAMRVGGKSSAAGSVREPPASSRAPAAGGGGATAHGLGAQRGGAAQAPATRHENRIIQVDRSTTAAVHRGSHTLTVTHAETDGSKVVVQQGYGGGQSKLLNAYVARTDTQTGRVTRTYLDGHKVESGPGFTRLEVPGRYALTTHGDGLREATGRNGRLLYREAWRGTERRTVVRTVFSESLNNEWVEYETPIERTYISQTYFGVRTFAYQPVVFAADFFGVFLSPFAQPVQFDAQCTICPAPVVAFESPVQVYADPIDLVGDLEITSAVAESTAAPLNAGDAPSSPQPNPDVDYVTQQAADVQQEIDAAKPENDRLNEQIDALQNAPAEDTARASAMTTSVPQTVQNTPEEGLRPAIAYTVPDEVRKQIRSQVRDNLKLHEAKQPLTWPELVKSGRSKTFIFQVSDMISTVDTNGEDCALTGGDMLQLDDGAAPDDPALRMRVVTSKATSCHASAVVSVGIADAQNMLNDFNARQENIMRQVHTHITGTTQI